MRIIPDDTNPKNPFDYSKPKEHLQFGAFNMGIKWLLSESIQITDDEWNQIFHSYAARGYDKSTATWGFVEVMPFSQYLRELIELKRAQ